MSSETSPRNIKKTVPFGTNNKTMTEQLKQQIEKDLQEWENQLQQEYKEQSEKDWNEYYKKHRESDKN